MRSLRFVGLLPLGQPGPENVAGGVDIRVVDVTAAETSEHRPVPVSRLGVPAATAHLRRMSGRHCDDCPTSIFRFVGEQTQEQTPSGIEDGTVEPGLRRGSVWLEAAAPIGTRRRTASEVRDAEAFVDDHVVLVYERPRKLVGVVEPLPGDSSMDRAETLRRSMAVRSTALLAGESALGGRQVVLGASPHSIFGKW